MASLFFSEKYSIMFLTQTNVFLNLDDQAFKKIGLIPASMSRKVMLQVGQLEVKAPPFTG